MSMKQTHIVPPHQLI